MSRALVVGGGFAGMAAAVALADAGAAVTLVEARRRLGGRAYSMTDAATGDVIDNGQHVFTGACTAVLDLCRRLGTDRHLWFQKDLRIDLLDRDGPARSLICPPLPAPAHLLAGLLRMRGLGWSDRLSALRLGAALRGLDRPGRAGELDALTAEEWFERLGQTEAARRVLWRPLALAIVNEETARASALPLARTLSESFLGARANSRMVLPGLGLSRLYEEALPRYLAARGGEVRLSTRVTELLPAPAGDAVAGARTADGARLRAERVIAALPHQVLPSLLPDRWSRRPPFAAIGRLGSVPIVSVHLWMDRPLTGSRFLGLLGTGAQWLFNRRALAGDVEGHGLSVVYSAARAQAELPADELVASCLADLRALLPAARPAAVLGWRVIKERRATFSARPGTDALRPAATTPVRGLFLAGDWTATGLPATIEGAVRSGYRAAGALLDSVRAADAGAPAAAALAAPTAV